MLMLHHLYLLPVQQLVEFKQCLWAYYALHGMSLVDAKHMHVSIGVARQVLRSTINKCQSLHLAIRNQLVAGPTANSFNKATDNCTLTNCYFSNVTSNFSCIIVNLISAIYLNDEYMIQFVRVAFLT